MTAEAKFTFNAKKAANWLIASGIIGLLLSFIFYIQRGELKPNPHEIEPGFSWYPYAGYITLYYAFNSCMVLLSGYLLKKANRIGLYFLLLAILSVIASLFIVTDAGSLFLFTIVAVLVNLIFVFPPIGAFVFLLTLLVNIILIPSWFKFTAKQSKPAQL